MRYYHSLPTLSLSLTLLHTYTPQSPPSVNLYIPLLYVSLLPYYKQNSKHGCVCLSIRLSVCNTVDIIHYIIYLLSVVLYEFNALKKFSIFESNVKHLTWMNMF